MQLDVCRLSLDFFTSNLHSPWQSLHTLHAVSRDLISWSLPNLPGCGMCYFISVTRYTDSHHLAITFLSSSFDLSITICFSEMHYNACAYKTIFSMMCQITICVHFLIHIAGRW